MEDFNFLMLVLGFGFGAIVTAAFLVSGKITGIERELKHTCEHGVDWRALYPCTQCNYKPKG